MPPTSARVDDASPALGERSSTIAWVSPEDDDGTTVDHPDSHAADDAPADASPSRRSGRSSSRRPSSGSSRSGTSRSGSSTRSSRPSSRSGRSTGSSHGESRRHVDKARTRRALLDGALELLTDRSLDNVGIREVTRAAGVAPAAFYRHFDRIDDLGLVLVDEVFATLRQLMRDARDDVVAADDIAKRSVTALVRHIHDHRPHYQFLVREQYSALVDVRVAIRTEIRLFSTELATDLARLPVTGNWPVKDLVMLADMIVDLMVRTAQRLLEVIDEAPEREPEVIADTVRRLRYLTFGATAWRPSR
ncbi:MAG: TetR family transcriptional regulator [Acidimicrobiales bacterium]|nr:TetR family transcriptional regulator [Acidimicrobiales bacterium]